MHSFNISDETLAKLRALRLWHWQGVLYNRKLANYYANIRNAAATESRQKKANFHLSQVQLLNDFFQMGDTAENDNEPGVRVRIQRSQKK